MRLAQPQLPALNLTIGLWVIVKYEGEEFPGEVTCMEDSDVEANVMHRSANSWKWPRPEDKIFYSRNEIVRVINPPSVAGNRGQFVLKTFSICLCYVYKYLLCLTVPSYAQNVIYTILNHTCTSVTGFVYVPHKV